MLAAVPTSASEVIQVVEGQLKPEKSALYQKFEKLLGWADEVRRLGIRANADVPKRRQGRLRASAPAASASAAPSTCSSARTGCPTS